MVVAPSAVESIGGPGIMNLNSSAKKLREKAHAYEANAYKHSQYKTVAKHLREAAVNIEQLQKALTLETKRLNYIESYFHNLGFTQGDTWFKLQPYGTKVKRYKSMREAIDDNDRERSK